MTGIINTSVGVLTIDWVENCSLLPAIKAHPSLQGTANNIPGEVFFYQSELDIPYNGKEKQIFEIGDLVYWKASDGSRMAILLMYGHTDAGNGMEIKTPMPGIKIGQIKEKEKIQLIPTGSDIQWV